VSSLDAELRRKLGRHVRQLRQDQDLTLKALAEQIGVTPSALSQIERGKSEPSLGTLWRLGGALKASLFDFFAHDHPASVDVTPAGDRTVVEFDRFRYEAIAQSSRRTIDLFVLRLEPGHGPVRDLVRHPGEEAGLVLSGRMEVVVAGQAHPLGPGDGIWFLSTEPHTFVPIGDEPCVSVWADTIPEAEGEGDVWSRSVFGAGADSDGASQGVAS
jgi:transcriptional regulator with XRE-family HTH domain